MNKLKQKLIRLVYYLVIAGSYLVFINSAFAADIDLGEGYHVPENFSSIIIEKSNGTAIQNAVNHIRPGGTIFLTGNFTLNKMINIKKNLTIKGNNAVLKLAKANDRIIRCQGDITLEGLDISGGSSTNGGGVKIDGGTVNIINCKIHNNTGLLGGGGIHSEGINVTITSCDISDNTVLAAGGGISFLGGNVTITDSKIRNNKSMTLSGGGFAASGTNINMKNCSVTGNSAKKDGGSFYILKTVLTATSCDISSDYYMDKDSTYHLN